MKLTPEEKQKMSGKKSTRKSLVQKSRLTSLQKSTKSLDESEDDQEEEPPKLEEKKVVKSEELQNRLDTLEYSQALSTFDNSGHKSLLTEASDDNDSA